MFPEQTLIQKARKYMLEKMEAHSIHLVVIYSGIWFCGALVGTICGFFFSAYNRMEHEVGCVIRAWPEFESRASQDAGTASHAEPPDNQKTTMYAKLKQQMRIHSEFQSLITNLHVDLGK